MYKFDNARFITWLGAKEKLMSYMVPYLPTVPIRDYYEPFLGSGSMFYFLVENGLIPLSSKVYLSDINIPLIISYLGIRDHLEETLFYLEQHFYQNSKERFLNERKSTYTGIAQIAASFIYVNKASYGGIYRETSIGRSSACFRDEKLKEYRCDDYWKASIYLQRCTLKIAPYYQAIRSATEGDFIYIDPPYENFYKGSLLGQYGNTEFSPSNHEELEKTLHGLNDNGVLWMLSNSDTPMVRQRYKRYRIIEIDVKYRFTKLSMEKAEKKKELLITNYNRGKIS